MKPALWNGLQGTAFDISAFVPQDGLIGTLLSSVFGYQDAPTVGEVIVYFAYLIPALILFFSPPRPEPVAARSLSALQDLTHSQPARPIREE